jgi:hypothetical protein
MFQLCFALHESHIWPQLQITLPSVVLNGGIATVEWSTISTEYWDRAISISFRDTESLILGSVLEPGMEIPQHANRHSAPRTHNTQLRTTHSSMVLTHDYYLNKDDTESLDWTYDAPVTLLGRFLNM